MIELKQALYELLESVHARVYHKKANDQAVFPYLVYSISNSLVNGDQETFIMDVDVWDDDPDTTSIDTISDAVWKKLHKHHHLDDDIQFSIYRQTRFSVEDDDNRLGRIKMTFEIKYFDRGMYE